MSECLQVEIDPLKISDEFLNGVLISVDVLSLLARRISLRH